MYPYTHAPTHPQALAGQYYTSVGTSSDAQCSVADCDPIPLGAYMGVYGRMDGYVWAGCLVGRSVVGWLIDR